MMIDTHSHLYDTAFEADLDDCLARDRAAGVEMVLLPAIDSSTHEAMWSLCRREVGYCLPMIGLHPTSVNEIEDYRAELRIVEQALENPPAGRIYAIGEIGLDLHWRQDRLERQQDALRRQIELALRHGLPVAIHTRDAWTEMHKVLSQYSGRGLKGVMHAFSGDHNDYLRVKSYGDFAFGIGGVVTYKKAGLDAVVERMSLGDIVLESDAPYLPPTPFRGRRNESGMMVQTRDKIAQLHGVTSAEIERITTENAKRIFSII